MLFIIIELPTATLRIVALVHRASLVRLLLKPLRSADPVDPGPLTRPTEKSPGGGGGGGAGPWIRLRLWSAVPLASWLYIEQGRSASHVRRNDSMMAGEDATWLRMIIKAVLDNCHKFFLSIIQISPQRDAKCNRVWCDFKPCDAWCEVYMKCWWWMMCGYRDAWCEAIIKHDVKPSWCMLWSHHAAWCEAILPHHVKPSCHKMWNPHAWHDVKPPWCMLWNHHDAWCEAIMMHDVKSSCHIMWNPHACHDMKPPWCMMWSYHDIRYEAKMMHDMNLSCYMMWNLHD